jgi:hypothetical protein
MPIPPRYQCTRCEDWGTVVAPNGRGTIACPGQDGKPCTAPKTTNSSSTTAPHQHH